MIRKTLAANVLLLLSLSVVSPSFASASASASVLSPAPSRVDWFGEIQPPTQVNDRLWRSGRPTEQTLTMLYAKGVRVIIDLENDLPVVNAEAALAKRMGFTFLSYPTESFWAPDDQKMEEILRILSASPQPVLVHCYHGEDRTGLVIGLERVFLEKWPAGKAYDEMLAIGFHRILLGLDQYFHEKVGLF